MGNRGESIGNASSVERAGLQLQGACMNTDSSSFSVASSATLTLKPTTNNSIKFHAGSSEIMVLDDKGMTYKGVRIEDAGEAHRAFLEVMGAMKAARNS